MAVRSMVSGAVKAGDAITPSARQARRGGRMAGAGWFSISFFKGIGLQAIGRRWLRVSASLSAFSDSKNNALLSLWHH